MDRRTDREQPGPRRSRSSTRCASSLRIVGAAILTEYRGLGSKDLADAAAGASRGRRRVQDLQEHPGPPCRDAIGLDDLEPCSSVRPRSPSSTRRRRVAKVLRDFARTNPSLSSRAGSSGSSSSTPAARRRSADLPSRRCSCPARRRSSRHRCSSSRACAGAAAEPRLRAEGAHREPARGRPRSSERPSAPADGRGARREADDRPKRRPMPATEPTRRAEASRPPTPKPRCGHRGRARARRTRSRAPADPRPSRADSAAEPSRRQAEAARGGADSPSRSRRARRRRGRLGRRPPRPRQVDRPKRPPALRARRRDADDHQRENRQGDTMATKEEILDGIAEHDAFSSSPSC